jgi:monofunctional biosynthetic peptidoglycan transglycosylase
MEAAGESVPLESDMLAVAADAAPSPEQWDAPSLDSPLAEAAVPERHDSTPVDPVHEPAPCSAPSGPSASPGEVRTFAADPAPGLGSESLTPQSPAVPEPQHTFATFSMPEAVAAATAPTPTPARPDAGDASVEARGLADRLAHRIDWDRIKSIGVRAAKVAAIVFCAWLATALLLIAVYRFINPPVSAMMVLRWVSGTSISRDWVPLQSISPNLVRAVIASEDDRFCSHWGIDFDAIGAAIRRSSKGPPRGASTITMQVSKNLFLWPAKSYVRKLLEVPLTYAIELMWPKRRILEVYLNIAEWGPGIFGAEAASQAHFGTPARRLSSRQAALLAVALPNPHVRNAGRPGRWTSGRASVIQRRAAGLGAAAGCVLGER